MAGSSGSPASPAKVRVSVPTRSSGNVPPRVRVMVWFWPDAAVAGVVMVTLGGGGRTMRNGSEFDAAPPTSVTLAIAAAVSRVAGTCAVSCVAVTNVVVRGCPFQASCKPELRFVPVTVRVNAGDPTFADEGLSAVIAGAGRISKGSELEGTPSAGVGTTGEGPGGAGTGA